MEARPDLHSRFLAIVERATERAAQEELEFRRQVGIRVPQTSAERRRIHFAITGPPRWRMHRERRPES